MNELRFRHGLNLPATQWRAGTPCFVNNFLGQAWPSFTNQKTRGEFAPRPGSQFEIRGVGGFLNRGDTIPSKSPLSLSHPAAKVLLPSSHHQLNVISAVRNHSERAFTHSLHRARRELPIHCKRARLAKLLLKGITNQPSFAIIGQWLDSARQRTAVDAHFHRREFPRQTPQWPGMDTAPEERPSRLAKLTDSAQGPL